VAERGLGSAVDDARAATPPAVAPSRGARVPRRPAPDGRRRRLYVPVAAKFAVALAGALGWVALAVWLSRPWLADLTGTVGAPLGWVIVTLLAYVPGFVVALLAVALILDRQPPLRVANPTTGVTVVIAARNEAAGIAETVRYVAASRYDGPLRIVVADNGSTDATAEAARAAAEAVGAELVVVREETPGKAHALNRALEVVDTPYLVTVDADTLLHPDALRRLVSRLESAPPDTVAVAGAVLVRNSRTNLLTRMQEWDYYLGIASVKRMQGLFQSTLVAQGAFSLYRTAELRRVGGWPDAIGEDIVVTWRLMCDGSRVMHEPTAVAFTDVPERLRHFVRQRARWARGMFEGLAAVPPWRQRRLLSGLVASVDFLIPLLDIGYVLVWIPGLALAVAGLPVIVGLWTLLVLPITLVVYGTLRRYQRRRVFGPLGLRVRRNRRGYLAYLLLYQAICSSAALIGYTQELTRSRRRWK
jgi:biofilm PGA synthesis N-glycosyltransferase PgaC